MTRRLCRRPGTIAPSAVTISAWRPLARKLLVRWERDKASVAGSRQKDLLSLHKFPTVHNFELARFCTFAESATEEDNDLTRCIHDTAHKMESDLPGDGLVTCHSARCMRLNRRRWRRRSSS